MAGDIGKRNSEGGTAPLSGACDGAAGGVGGRQGTPPTPLGGGGYLDECSVLNFRARGAEKKRDPRLDELVRLGLQRVWLDVAEAIGVDRFLAMWRILDTGFQATADDAGRMLVPMRSYRTYLKFQRNRYIETLAGMGYNAQQIRDKLRSQLCETISLRHIYRLRNNG